MELHFLDLAIIIAYVAFTIWIGIWFKSQASSSIEQYFLGGRNLSWWLAGVSMVATTFAADTPLAVTELVAWNGVSGNWIWWNMLAGGMLTAFFFARLWRRAGVVTDVEFLEMRYSGKPAMWLRVFRAFHFGWFLNILIIGWVNLALMALLKVFFDIPDHQLIFYVALAMGIVLIYVTLAGLRGVVITDFFQFIIAMAGSIVLAVMVINSEAIGGLSGLQAKLPDESFNFFPDLQFSSAEGASTILTLSLGSFLAFTALQWWASWYPGAEPGGGGYIAQRMLSVKNEKQSTLAVLVFQIGFFCIRPWPWILVALAVVVLYPDLPREDARFGYVLAMRDYLPTGLKGLMLVAFFSAYMSTISTQLNWGASYLINDVYHRFIRPSATQKVLISASRIATIVLALCALWVTTRLESISGVWAFIIECGAGLGMVLILRWYWWRINVWSEIVASIAPFVGFGLTQWVFSIWDPSWKDGILINPKGFIFTLVFTTAAWLLATFLTKPEKTETLERFYKKVRPDGFWKPFQSGNQTGNIFAMLVGWLSAIIMAYSILFATGSFLFLKFEEGFYYGLAAIISCIGVIWSLKIINKEQIN